MQRDSRAPRIPTEIELMELRMEIACSEDMKKHDDWKRMPLTLKEEIVEFMKEIVKEEEVVEVGLGMEPVHLFRVSGSSRMNSRG